ncbi:MAG: 50S ribosomal protein L24 [Chloroflexota bacterium]|nr:50S ribosomal protein L24 [Chloroflexota bacterium]
MKIRTGDTVEVIRGENKGERGQVQRVLRGRRGGRESGQPDPSRDRLVVAGVNMIIKHQRRTGSVRTQTGRIEREAPIHVSNIMLVCPRCNTPTRIGYEVLGDGSKARLCKKCGETMD